ncbi:squalene/phytoene synthase family protein [bacterium]|nr:squalene/phytoene synthase family protein [bacterium]
MSLNACAAIVEKGDPERFRAVMAATVPARRILFPLYAFNVEVTRAPWVTKEPMIAEMRLQWWADVLEEIASGGVVRKHEVVDALRDVLDAQGARDLMPLVASRRWDIYSDAFEDEAHLDEYIDATTSGLLWTGARLLGATDETAVRDLGYGVGVANFLRAIPELEERGRKPLVDGTSDGVRELATKALARHTKGSAPKAVRLAGFLTKPTLTRAKSDPQRVVQGMLEIGPFAQGIHLLKTNLLG